MKRKQTTIEIIAAWLQTRMGQIIGSYELETNVPKYAMLYYQHAVTPGTVNRKFRNLRADEHLLAKYGITLQEQPHGKEAKWLVKPYVITRLPLEQSPIAMCSSPQESLPAA